MNNYGLEFHRLVETAQQEMSRERYSQATNMVLQALRLINNTFVSMS